MKILAISSEPYLPKKNPLFSIYVLDQIKLCNELVSEMNLMCLSYLPYNCFFLNRALCVFDGIKINQKNIVFSAMLKQFIPIKFLNERKVARNLLNYGTQRFERYLELYGKPDIIHAHNSFNAGALAQSIWIKYGIPYIITEHSSILFSDISQTKKSLLNAIYENAIVFSCVSEALKKFIIRNLELNNKSDKIIILPNALDEMFENVCLVDNRVDTDFTFINVANLVDVKNHELLIDSFFSRFNGVCNVKLKIIGDGLLIEKLRAKVKQLNIEEQVFFLGYQEKSKVKEELEKANAFVLSSKNETFGIVVTEALACGLPVVVTPCCGPEMLIDESNGFISKGHTIHTLGEAMYECFKNISKFDRRAIQKNCIEKFGSSKFKMRISEMYSIKQ